MDFFKQGNIVTIRSINNAFLARVERDHRDNCCRPYEDCEVKESETAQDYSCATLEDLCNVVLSALTNHKLIAAQNRAVKAEADKEQEYQAKIKELEEKLEASEVKLSEIIETSEAAV